MNVKYMIFFNLIFLYIELYLYFCTAIQSLTNKLKNMKINLNELDKFNENYEMTNSYFSSNKRQKKSQKKIKKIHKDSWK